MGHAGGGPGLARVVKGEVHGFSVQAQQEAVNAGGSRAGDKRIAGRAGDARPGARIVRNPGLAATREEGPGDVYRYRRTEAPSDATAGLTKRSEGLLNDAAFARYQHHPYRFDLGGLE